MIYFEEVKRLVANGESLKHIAEKYNLSKASVDKARRLANIALGLIEIRFAKEELYDLYVVQSIPVEDIAKMYSVSKAYVQDAVRAFEFRRGNKSCYRAGHKKIWNKGLNKNTDERIKKMAEDRIGENNPMYGATPWNKGLTKEDDERIQGVSDKLTGLKPSDEARKKMAKAKMGKTGESSNRWSGGHKIGMYAAGEYKQYAHRLIAEEILGRKLLTKEHVHHKDKNTLNNSLENLIVLHNGAHSKLHHAMNKDDNLDQAAWLKENGYWFVELHNA